MGSVANGLFWSPDYNSSWCETKCALDKPFFMPYVQGESIFLQLDLLAAGLPWGYQVCNVHACLPDGTRVLPNLMSTLGPAYWKANVSLTEQLNTFTMRIPGDFGGCQTVLIRNPECCVLNLLAGYGTGGAALAAGLAKGSFSTLVLHYQGTAYNMLTGPLPTGFVWRNEYPRKYITMPCPGPNLMLDIYVTGMAVDWNGDLTAFEWFPDKQTCPDKFCNCYLDVSVTAYNSANQLIVNSIVTTTGPGVAVLPIMDGSVPGVSPASMHTLVGGRMHIPIDCEISEYGFSLNTLAGSESTTWYIAAESADCTDNRVERSLGCFMFELELSYDGQCGVSRLYTEPYECPICEPTVLLQATHGGQTRDCFGIWRTLDLTAGEETSNSGALTGVGTDLRIPAVIRDLPSKFVITKNEKCFTYKSEVVQRFELQGTKAYPPYFARRVESMIAGNRFFANGQEYQVRGDQVFETIQINGISAYRLKASLELCSCVAHYDCT